MSLKPPKKSDLGKDWLSKRRDLKRSISPEYHLIVTEGTKTEPLYFEAIKRRINEKFRERISLKIVGKGSSTVTLFTRAEELAQNNRNKYKHIWIVYDTDDFPKDKIDAVVDYCATSSTKDCKYHAIWSNQCIELWFLLHFGYLHSDLHRDEYFPKLSVNLKGLGMGNYEKNREDMFEILEPFVEIAIKNAEQLQSLNEGKSPSNSKPGTMVHELIKVLKPYF